MNHHSHIDLRRGVLLAVIVTVIAALASLDPSCQPRSDIPHLGPRRSIAP